MKCISNTLLGITLSAFLSIHAFAECNPDDTGPTLSGVPSDITVECANGIPTPLVTATDECDANPKVILDLQFIDVGSSAIIVERTWTAIDASGNSTSAMQLVRVLDETNPEITCPADVAVGCPPDFDPINTGIATAVDNCDGAPAVYSSDSLFLPAQEWKSWRENPLPCRIERTWATADACGNEASCLQTIVIFDSTPPVIVCPPDATHECPGDTSIATNGSAIGTDACMLGDPVISSSDNVTDTCGATATVVRRWTAVDSCGNASSCDQTLTVVDTTAPVISCPDDVTVNCEDDRSSAGTGVATGTDTCVYPEDHGHFWWQWWHHGDDDGHGHGDDDGPGHGSWSHDDDDAGHGWAHYDDNDDHDHDWGDHGGVHHDDDDDHDHDWGHHDDQHNSVEVKIAESDSVAAGSCPQQEAITRTWTATDACGNASSCKQIVAVVDDENPAISCPADVTVNCEDDRSSENTGDATATDNCDNDVTITESDSVAAGSCPQEEVITRTWTGTDDCGNASSCEQIVSVVDDEAPAITCPVDVTIECTEVLNKSAGDSNCVTDILNSATSPFDSDNTGVATAKDNCAATDVLVIGYSDAVVDGDCPQEGVVTRTWTSTDTCGNQSQCDQVISVVDTTAPMLTCPADVTISCDGSTATSVTGSASSNDHCDLDVAISVADAVADGSCEQNSLITRTWTATDDCDNASSCAQLITVVDTMAPAISCPVDVTIECDASTSTGNTGEASATDNCDATPGVSYASAVSAGSCADESVITRTWTAIDACGNSASCAQVITVVDTTAPVITSSPAGISVQCTDEVPASDISLVTATDNCGEVTITHELDASDGNSCPETITRTYRASDGCGNFTEVTQTIEINDTIAPEVTGVPTDVMVECIEDVPAPLDAGLEDNCDDDRVISPKVTDNGGSGCSGDPLIITRTYAGSDDCGNLSDTVIQTVTVLDMTDPMVSCPADVTLECPADTSVETNGRGSGSDNCAAGVSISYSDMAMADCGNAETIERMWTATDDCGNSSSCGQVITVVDTTAPSIECPEDATVDCSTSTVPSTTGSATGSDSCGDVSIGHSDVSTAGCGNTERIERTWISTDECGNNTSCGQVITVVDTTAPSINCPADAVLDCPADTGIAANGTATGSDSCSDVSISSTDSTVSGCGNTEMIRRTWTSTDECGNNTSCDQVIALVDTTAPSIECPEDATVECGEATDQEALGKATGSDSCSSVNITMDAAFEEDCGNTGVITRVWSATDECDNSSSCTQTITIVDTTPPEVECITNDITEFDGDDDDDDDDDDSVSFTATATDACGDVRVQVGQIYCVLPGDDDDDDDDDCKVSASGATIKVNSSGAAGTVINWTAKGTDKCGNTTTINCSVTVLEDEDDDEDDDHYHDHPWWWWWRHW